MTFFSTLFSRIDAVLTVYLTGHLPGVMAYVAPVAHISAIILVVGIGAAMSLGWTEAPAKKMFLAVAMIVFVIEFATNAAIYNQYVVDFFTGMPDELLGLTSDLATTSSVGELLDDFGDYILTGIEKIWQGASGISENVQAAVVCCLIFLIWVLMSVAILIAMLIAKIGLTLLITFGPIFILLLMLPQTRDYFSKWLGYTIQYVILAMLVGGVLSLTKDIVEIYFQAFSTTEAGVDFFKISPPALVMTVLLWIFYQLPNIASSLSGGIGLSIGNSAGSMFSKGTSALTAPVQKGFDRTAGERLNAKRSARQQVKVAQEKVKLRNKQ